MFVFHIFVFRFHELYPCVCVCVSMFKAAEGNMNLASLNNEALSH